MLFGLQPWAADAANAIPLFFFIFAILRMLAGVPIGPSVAATVALLLLPIFSLAIVDFRPDMWCSGFTVLGTLIIVLRDPRELKNAALVGVILAATLLMKPTFAPLVLILYGVALVLRLGPT
ncbi:hypothetical protein AB4156_43490, partial [Cupriavidus sp. 2MCAB6]|uniref:hypothetical protein n=1 Tax=Cupriavidus sp. 2MCAB6 TaxID=3232981 RepID=UPI003F8DAD66